MSKQGSSRIELSGKGTWEKKNNEDEKCKIA